MRADTRARVVHEEDTGGPAGWCAAVTRVGGVRIDVVSKEYPPAIYGGAGVHVTELVRALRARGDLDVRVHAFGEPRAEHGTSGHPDLPELAGANPALQTFGVGLSIAGATEGADVVHSHTWYANLAGHLGALLGGVPHVVTAHSLEPMRPWKAEQLGGGYRLSSWAERTAYEAADAVVAVSAAMRADILRTYPGVDPAKVAVIHNGIDSELWRREPDEDAVRRHGIDPDRPAVAFVGRITRQKGLPYLLRAVAALPPEVQVVLLAGSPDTLEIKAEVEHLVDDLRRARDGVVWIPDMLPRREVVAILSAASVFVCPSVYEPLGIVNLEAMACELPVVATATGGIPEVVVDGETGWLVPIEQVQDGTGIPVDEKRFIADLAATLTAALGDPARAQRMGLAGRRRAVESFSWARIGDQTHRIYLDAVGRRTPSS
jgi:alpha-maltose-1-phosphate synthase